MTVVITSRPPGLRERKRIALMRRVQDVALDLFERSGFDTVTIDEIATVAEVSAPTIYRHFSTKENLVLWDEYEPMVSAAIAQRLLREPVVSAVVGGVLDGVERVYTNDAARILRRAQLVRSHEAIRAANAAVLLKTRHELSEFLARGGVGRDTLEAAVLAGAIVATLEAALDHWVLQKGKVPLARVLQRAFLRLRHIGGARLRHARVALTPKRRSAAEDRSERKR